MIDLTTNGRAECIYYIRLYFYKMFPEWSYIPKVEANRYLSELKYDYIIDDDELMNADLKDIFEHFMFVGENVYVFKTECGMDRLISASKGMMLDTHSDTEFNIDTISDEFNSHFSETYCCPRGSVVEFVRQKMVECNTYVHNGAYICCPNIDTLIIDNISVTGDDNDLIQIFKKKSVDRFENSAWSIIKFTPNIVSLDKDFFICSKDQLQEGNKYIDALDRFRVPRNIKGLNIEFLIKGMLDFSLMSPNDTFCRVGVEKFMYASFSKINMVDDIELIKTTFDKVFYEVASNVYKIKREV